MLVSSKLASLQFQIYYWTFLVLLGASPEKAEKGAEYKIFFVF